MQKIRAPLFVDPIYNGAADPTIIKNEQDGKYYIFYTQRRASSAFYGVAYCYGSKIGVAVSEDGGGYWHYLGALDLEFEFGHNTFWAPEVIWNPEDKKYHMFVSYIRGIQHEWRGDSHILHYTSDNLFDWKYCSVVELDSHCVIDACLYPLPNGGYRMWYKEGKLNCHTCYADSRDLVNWELKGEATLDTQEGPNVFFFGGKYWLIACEWCGQAVYSSDDLVHFTRQEGERLLCGSGTRPFDGAVGRHADVIVIDDKAYIVYFVHYNDSDNIEHPTLHPPTVLQMAELEIKDGRLVCDRNKEAYVELY